MEKWKKNALINCLYAKVFSLLLHGNTQDGERAQGMVSCRVLSHYILI
jgi:hypothetical protein